MSESYPVPEEEFRLASGGGVLFSPDKSLRPDRVSEAIGYEAAQIINMLYKLNQPLKRALRVLDLGCGTGICLVALLSQIRQDIEVDLVGIDISGYSALKARDNLVAATATFYVSTANINIYEGDYFNEGPWYEDLFDVIIMNPPFKVYGESVSNHYSKSPPTAIYADEESGVSHYAHLIPRSLRLLSNLDGASILARRPFYDELSSERAGKLNGIIADSIKQNGQKFCVMTGQNRMTTLGVNEKHPRHYQTTIARNNFLQTHIQSLLCHAYLTDHDYATYALPDSVAQLIGCKLISNQIDNLKLAA
jgi:methylase of polypeptide subunit release factors